VVCDRGLVVASVVYVQVRNSALNVFNTTSIIEINFYSLCLCVCVGSNKRCNYCGAVAQAEEKNCDMAGAISMFVVCHVLLMNITNA